MSIINMHQAKTHLSRLVDRAAVGEEIVIGRAGRPVARLVAYERSTTPRVPGLWRGRVTIKPGFDDVDEDVAELFGA